MPVVVLAKAVHIIFSSKNKSSIESEKKKRERSGSIWFVHTFLFCFVLFDTMISGVVYFASENAKSAAYVRTAGDIVRIL
jgi:hypothetical protein